MLEITKPAPDRVDIHLHGEIDAELMAEALDDLIAKSEGIKNGKMLYRIMGFAMPTIAALGVEMTRLPKLFTLLGKFHRCAVMSDTAWIRQAAEIEGALIPGLSIKSFDLDEKPEAEAWLNQS